MAPALWLKHAAEIYTHEGPTGKFEEVVRGQVVDYGGNVLFEGTADECVKNQKTWRVPTELRPTETRSVAGKVAGADHTW